MSRVTSPPSSRTSGGPLPSGTGWPGCSSQYSRASRPSRRRRAFRSRRWPGGVVLGGEDVAGGPAHIGAERDQRLDEHCGLDGHVQRPGDPDALEGAAASRTSCGPTSGRAFRARRRRFSGPSRRRDVPDDIVRAAGVLAAKTEVSGAQRRLRRVRRVSILDLAILIKCSVLSF